MSLDLSARRVFVGAGLALHLAVAALAWLLLPRGFAPLEPRFWSNQAGPVLIAALALTGLLAQPRGRARLLARVQVGLLGVWVGAAAGAALTFPRSGPRLAGLLALGAVAQALASLAAAPSRAPRRHPWGPALLGLIAGATWPVIQRAPVATTQPARAGAPWIELADPPVPAGHTLARRPGWSAVIVPLDGVVFVETPRLQAQLRPLLSFDACSPDGAWSILAPAGTYRPGPRRAIGQRLADASSAFTWTGPLDRARLDARDTPAGLALDAWTELQAPVDSHLNTYAELGVSAQGALALSFSPCPDARIAVVPADYPVGRPARFAYLGADGVLRVVEGRSGEKGPFRELARGRLARDDPLTLTLWVDDRAALTVTLVDWAAQCSTATSPTAGWGVPQNAIGFRLTAPGAAFVYVTLAATGIGRGWDSVTHAAGAYRSRVVVAPVAD